MVEESKHSGLPPSDRHQQPKLGAGVYDDDGDDPDPPPLRVAEMAGLRAVENGTDAGGGAWTPIGDLDRSNQEALDMLAQDEDDDGDGYDSDQAAGSDDEDVYDDMGALADGLVEEAALVSSNTETTLGVTHEEAQVLLGKHIFYCQSVSCLSPSSSIRT